MHSLGGGGGYFTKSNVSGRWPMAVLVLTLCGVACLIAQSLYCAVCSVGLKSVPIPYIVHYICEALCGSVTHEDLAKRSALFRDQGAILDTSPVFLFCGTGLGV